MHSYHILMKVQSVAISKPINVPVQAKSSIHLNIQWVRCTTTVYFFDIHIHRTLILIEFDDRGEATVVWTGTHQEYEAIFKNNKNTIEKWLRAQGLIE